MFPSGALTHRAWYIRNLAARHRGPVILGVMATETRQAITVRNPATGEVIGEVPIMLAEDVRRVVDRAREAQIAWGALAVVERCRRLKAFRKALVASAEALADLIVRENGKPRPEALVTEILSAVDLMHYFGRKAPEILRPKSIHLHLARHRRSYLHFRPKGVVGIISPWNFPFSIPIGEAAMAFMAGNAVVLKPSEITPLIALEAKAIWDRCGMSPDLFQVVTGGPDVGKALIDSGIDHLSFTGSVASGRKVAAACGERLIPVTLELGGKAPAIICADADIERAARALVWGGFANSGQACASVERVYAVRAIHDPLVKRVIELTRELRQGDPGKSEVDVGSMTFSPQLEVAKRQIEDAVGKGAIVATGGAAAEGLGIFFPPTVLTGCTPEMAVMREETFGPLLPIMAVDSEQEALRLANQSHLGLNAYVFTRDGGKALRLAEQIEAGTVMVNDVMATHGFPETPWGGLKASGLGRVHSEIGLMDLVQIRHVNYPRIPIPREVWWFPYRESYFRMGIALLKRLFG